MIMSQAIQDSKHQLPRVAEEFLKSAYFVHLDKIIEQAIGKKKAVGKAFLLYFDHNLGPSTAGNKNDSVPMKIINFQGRDIENEGFKEFDKKPEKLKDAIYKLVEAIYHDDEVDNRVEIMIKHKGEWAFVKVFTIETNGEKLIFGLVIIRNSFARINKRFDNIMKRVKQGLERYFSFFNNRELDREKKVELIKKIKQSATSPGVPDYINYLITGELTK